jgi:hypothetical protein
MYEGVWDCVLKTVKNDGLRGLYRGYGATIINLLPVSAMFFVDITTTISYKHFSLS